MTTTQSASTAMQVSAVDISKLRVFARTCAAEWTRLWTVRGTWLFMGAMTVVMLGLGTALGFEAAADPVEIQGGPAWETAQFIAMPAQFALLALALTAVTADYATGGIIATLQWTPRRSVVFLARDRRDDRNGHRRRIAAGNRSALACYTTAQSALVLPVTRPSTCSPPSRSSSRPVPPSPSGSGSCSATPPAALISVFLLVLVLPLLLPAFGEWMTDVAKLLPGSGVTFLLLGEPKGRMTETSSITVMLAWAGGALLLGWLRLLRSDANR